MAMVLPAIALEYGFRVSVSLPAALSNTRVAFAHDWLVTWRGGEKVLSAMAELFPTAPIATLFQSIQILCQYTT